MGFVEKWVCHRQFDHPRHSTTLVNVQQSTDFSRLNHRDQKKHKHKNKTYRNQ